MKANHPSQAIKYFDQVGDVRSGSKATEGTFIAKTLLTGTEGDPGNYKVTITGGEGNGDWTTPRHRHNFEQVRYPISGDYVIAKKDIVPAGWVAYFPESAYYGPQLKSANLTMFELQFGGPSGIGYWSVAQRKRGYEELVAKGGKFEDGVYSWIDAQGQRHNQDGAEAVWEEIFGRGIEYPPARIRDVVLMNPQAFNWIKDKDQPGVAHRRMGTFSEREIKVGFMRIDAGATFDFGTEPASEILMIKEGALSYDGETYPKLGVMSTEAQEKPVTLRALDPTEILYVKLPTF